MKMSPLGFQHSDYCYPEFLKLQADSFFEDYKFSREIACPEMETKVPVLTSSTICRYCKQKYPVTTFRNTSHLFPEFLGNHTLIATDECDKCNSVISNYERDFANYIGFTRTIQSIKNKKGRYPEYISGDKAISAKTIQTGEKEYKVTIERADPSDSSFSFDEEKGWAYHTYTKVPYRPLNVYKFLVKIGLSILGENELPFYDQAFHFIKNKKIDNTPLLKSIAIIHQWDLPFTISQESPVVFLFEKKDRRKKLFTHIIQLSTLNYKFLIALPFNKQDHWIYSGHLEIPICPPIFGFEYPYSADTIQNKALPFYSTDLIKNDKSGMKIKMTKEEYLQMNGTRSPNEIKAIQLHRTPLGKNLNLE